MLGSALSPTTLSPSVLGAGAANSPLLPETIAVINAFSVKPSPTRASLMNDFIYAAIASGAWSMFDVLYMLASPDAQSAGINWKNPGGNTITAVSSPTHTADRGYAGNGTSSYLNLNYDASTGTKFLRNSAHLGVYVNSGSASGNSVEAGIVTASSGAFIRLRDSTGGGAGMRINTNATQGGGAVATALGHSVTTRSGSAASKYIRDGVENYTSTAASVAVPIGNLFALAANSSGTPASFSTRRVAAVHAGGNLTDAVNLSFYTNALRPFLLAIGAA